MPLKTLRDLYIEQLNELYSAEKHGLTVMPALEKSASSPDLAKAFREHTDQTRQHLERLDHIFDRLGRRPRGHETAGMKGLLEDCLTLSKDRKTEPHVRDAALIAVAQHVEHDEMAGYGCARSWATLLGESDAANMLQQTLSEEKEADTRLTTIADRINQEAQQVVPA